MQNAFIESFNGRLRDELLNETLFTSLAQTRVALGYWRTDYNGSRSHSQLGWKTPSEFAFTFHPRRDLALRYAKGSGPAPVAHTAERAILTPEANSRWIKNWGQGHIARGPQIKPRYRKQPGETSNVLRNGWLSTGDIAKMDVEG